MYFVEKIDGSNIFQFFEIFPGLYQLIQDLFISQSDRTDLQAQIGTDSQEYDIIEDDFH